MSSYWEERCWDTGNGTKCVQEDSRSELKRAWDGCKRGRRIASVGIPIVEEGLSISEPGTMAIKSTSCASGAVLELNQKRQKTTLYH